MLAMHVADCSKCRHPLRDSHAVTDADRIALTLAAAPYRYPARREADALEQLGLSPTRFWARVHRLLDDPAAEAEMPAEVRRLRRIRDARRNARAA